MALVLVAHTGCRPTEAAYIASRPAECIRKNKLTRHSNTYQAFTPELINKTDANYMWLLPKEMKTALEAYKLPDHDGW